MKHTPGPWTTFHDTLDNRTNGVCIYGNPQTSNETRMGVLVGCTDTLDPENEDHAEEMLANAERIVACVNACEPNGAVVKALKDTESYYLSNGGHEAYTQLAGVQSALAALEIK